MDKVIYSIKEAIKKQGLSETKAAKMACVDQTKVNRLLKGKVKKPDIEVIKKLCEVLKITPDTPAGLGDIREEAGYIASVVEIMKGMDTESQKDILLCAQKEKLLKELLKERSEKKAS